MNDEKQIILEMLKEGKITVEEASSLLEAIGGKKSRGERDFVSKLSESIDSVIKKTTETIGNIDFDNLEIPQYNIRGEINTHSDVRIDDEISEININIPNGKVYVERSSDSTISLIQDIWAKKSDIKDYLDVEVVDGTLNISVNSLYENTDITAVITLSLGKNIYDMLNIDLVNGLVEVSDVDFNKTSIDSVNARVIVINSCGDIDINNTNGKIDLKNTNGNLVVDNVNGPVYLSNVGGESVDVDLVNGNIRIDGLNSKNLDADTHSGNIRIYNIKDSERINVNTGFGSVVIDADLYDGDIKAFVLSQGLNLDEKYKNKIQKDGGYEVSTDVDNADLVVNASAPSGKINLR